MSFEQCADPPPRHAIRHGVIHRSAAAHSTDRSCRVESNPETSTGRRAKRRDLAFRKRRTILRLPLREPNPIKANQAGGRTEPQIAFVVLRNRPDLVGGETVFLGPASSGVL